ncbi:hypothetical protein [Enhygromyxa salina]|uniref:Bro-N domain-containing protein n=1 Tax=Enhygromyxa salina TaxID=215803 RepID=A0A2S9YC62_9BACT|nr:hypothetical protein [Enhygromyxa salina]PRQ02718.1 hypothetical protein ENSA7_55470 [Enhygromyxa salina]
MFEHDPHDHPSDEAWNEATRPPTGVSFIGSFEGRALITCDFDGKPCWLAGEVAAILGIGGASELARRLAIDWAAEARQGVHWVRIGQLELSELRLDLSDRGVVMPSSLAEASSTLLLLEPGIALVAARCSAEQRQASVSRRLLAHLRDRVIPDVAAIRRPSGSPLQREAAAIVRERIELERRRWEYDALAGLCDALADQHEIDPEVIWAYRVVAAEIALCGELWQLKPMIEPGWLSPTQIARRHLGVTAQRVGQVISSTGLRDSKVHSKAVLNKAVGRDRAVVSHLYSPAAVGLIERELRSRGYRRVE